MGLIVLILSCFVGFTTGLTRVLFFDASIWQGLVSYFTISCLLSGCVIGAMLLAGALRAQSKQEDNVQGWSDRIPEEA